METKKCTKCNFEKLFSEFNKDKKTKTGLTYYCTECVNKLKKEHYLKNSVREKEKYKLYREANPDKIKETKEKYNKKNPNKAKEYHIKTYNPIKAKEKNKLYRNSNPDKEKNRKKEYNKKNRNKVNEYAKQYRKLNSYNFAFRYLLLNALRRMGKPKENYTIELLGYSAIDLKNHISSLFTEGMSWDNYGEWHIDHIKRICEFDVDTPQHIVNGLSNLRPLWATTREINGIIYEGNLNRN